VNALYWVITTTCTVGYGDFHPVTTNERMVVMVCMIVQSGMFAYIIGDIGRMVSNFNMLATHFKERMNYVEKFLREKDIPI
jgi:Ion channel